MKSADARAEEVGSAKCQLAGEVLRAAGTLEFPAIGWSMLPAVWPGDTLVIERVSQHQVLIGDVVLIGRDGKLCAHRVIERAGDLENPRWITKGDALRVPDRPVNADELLGRVTYLIRAGRLMAIPGEINGIRSFIAKMASRSVPAARALVFLHKIRQS